MDNKKVVLVTGSSRGLGKSIISLFAKNDYNVIINYLNSKDDALELKDDLIDKYNNEVLCINADISNEKDVFNMINEIINRFGRIDVLVNNASICNDDDFSNKKKEDFMRVLEVNLYGTYLVSKCVGNYMLKKKYGKIINISSNNGIDAYYPSSVDYDASKAGIINLTHNMAKYYAPYINVNCICPGWINTSMNNNMDNEFKKLEEDKILLKRFANAEEIANVVLFLASDDASYVNDSIIKVDGGLNG